MAITEISSNKAIYAHTFHPAHPPTSFPAFYATEIASAFALLLIEKEYSRKTIAIEGVPARAKNVVVISIIVCFTFSISVI
jgi:hypothetical protein